MLVLVAWEQQQWQRALVHQISCKQGLVQWVLGRQKQQEHQKDLLLVLVLVQKDWAQQLEHQRGLERQLEHQREEEQGRLKEQWQRGCLMQLELGHQMDLLALVQLVHRNNW